MLHVNIIDKNFNIEKKTYNIQIRRATSTKEDNLHALYSSHIFSFTFKYSALKYCFKSFHLVCMIQYKIYIHLIDWQWTHHIQWMWLGVNTADLVMHTGQVKVLVLCSWSSTRKHLHSLSAAMHTTKLLHWLSSSEWKLTPWNSAVTF